LNKLVWEYYRSVASPGFPRAAFYVVDAFIEVRQVNDVGVEVWILQV